MMQTDNLHPQLLSYKPILAASEDSTSSASGDSTSTESSGPSGSVFAVLCFELGFLWTAPHIGSFYQIWLKKMSKYFRNSNKICLEFDWKCQQPMSSCWALWKDEVGQGTMLKIFYSMVFLLFKGEGDISRWRRLKLCIAHLSLGEARLAEDTSDDYQEPLLDYNKIVWCRAHELELPCILLACSLVFPTYNSMA